jgi:transposase
MNHPGGTEEPGGFVLECVKRVGSLPILKFFCDRLELARIVNEHLPLAPQAPVGLGEALVALVMNKLSAPHPLYRVEDWAQKFAVETLLGIEPEQMTDDRIARLLDELAEQAEPVKTAVCLKAIEAFGLDVSRLHWDLTTLHFEGEYEAQSPLWPLITYGYDPRVSGKHKQVRVGNMMAGDGAVSGLLHKTYSGNASDAGTVMDYLSLFREIRDRFGQKPRLIGDSKLLSHKNMIELEKADIFWLCPEARTSVLDETYLKLAEKDWKKHEYVSRREAALPEEDRTRYHGQEVSFELTTTEKADPESCPAAPCSRKRPKRTKKTYRFRRLFIRSSEELRAQRANRERQRGRLEEKLREFERKLRSTYWKGQSLEKAERALDRLLHASTVGSLYRARLHGDPDHGAYCLEWELDARALERAESLDGYYTLVTNIPAKEGDPAKLLGDYKAQSEIERRHADWKGPIRVRPLFLKKNKRITGLVMVLSIALLVFCLIEREVRLKLKDSNESMPGLLPVKRPVRATGRNVLDRLGYFNIVGGWENGKYVWLIPPPTPIEAELLRLLEIDLEKVIRGLPRPRDD